MTDSDIYQLVGKAYCDGMSQGIEKSASATSVLKSLFRAANKGKAALKPGAGGFIPGLTNIIKQIGFNPSLGATYGQFHNALTNSNGLASMARKALLNSAEMMSKFR